MRAGFFQEVTGRGWTDVEGNVPGMLMGEGERNFLLRLQERPMSHPHTAPLRQQYFVPGDSLGDFFDIQGNMIKFHG
jgi:hypothetical protein